MSRRNKFFLAASLALFFTQGAEALQAECFVQPPNGPPIPCPVDSNNIPLSSGVASGSVTVNASSAITLGATFQTIAAASLTRRSLEFTNICSVAGNCTTVSNTCYLFIAASGTPTIANSVPVGAGAQYIRSTGTIPTDAIQVTCDGTGDKYALKVQ